METVISIEPMGIAAHPKQDKLARLIQIYLTTIEEAGAFEKARQPWFEDSSWVEDLR